MSRGRRHVGRAQESRRHGSRGGSTAVLPRTAGTPPHSALGDGPSGGRLWSLHSSLYPPPAGRVGVCPRGLLSQVFGLFLLHEGRASGAWYRNGAAGSDFGYAHPPPGIRVGQDVLWGSFAFGNPDSKCLAWARSPAGIPQRRPWAAPGSSQIWVVWGEPEVLCRPSGLLGVPPDRWHCPALTWPPGPWRA